MSEIARQLTEAQRAFDNLNLGDRQMTLENIAVLVQTGDLTPIEAQFISKTTIEDIQTRTIPISDTHTK